MEINFFSESKNKLDYYAIYMISLILIYLVLKIYGASIKHNHDSKSNQKHPKILVLNDAQRILRYKFLLVSIFIKASTWIKAPYLYALYSRYHLFTTNDIGILFAIDSTSSLLLGPLIGSLCDLYGRKKFCMIFCILVVSYILMRVSGSIWMAYFSQILSGMSASLMDTSFESWIIFEANSNFEPQKKEEKSIYLREIFSKQIGIDCICSIFLTMGATILYEKYGILAPFYVCVVISMTAFFLILVLWNENDISKHNQKEESQLNDSTDASVNLNSSDDDQVSNDESTENKKIAKTVSSVSINKNDSFFSKIAKSFQIVREDKSLLYIGVIESSFKISLCIFIFLWTPLLESVSETKNVHPGAIMVCFMVARLIGSKVFQISKSVFKIDCYSLCLVALFISSITFFGEFMILNFKSRFLMLLIYDGMTGMLHPLLSGVKSETIPEKFRTTIMNLFRIPTNIISSTILGFNKVLSIDQICLITFGFLILGFGVNILLININRVKSNKVSSDKPEKASDIKYSKLNMEIRE